MSIYPKALTTALPPSTVVFGAAIESSENLQKRTRMGRFCYSRLFPTSQRLLGLISWIIRPSCGTIRSHFRPQESRFLLTSTEPLWNIHRHKNAGALPAGWSGHTFRQYEFVSLLPTARSTSVATKLVRSGKQPRYFLRKFCSVLIHASPASLATKPIIPV